MQKEKDVLYLETKDLDSLKEIGHGTDGSVYLYKNNLLIKLYHKSIDRVINIS